MSDKTYAETQGEAPFDWRHALNNPQQYDHAFLLYMAADWVTCACGNQCAIIPRHSVVRDECGRNGGMPMDSELSILGGQFASDVEWQEWEQAKDRLAKIEARSTVLIAEELAKLQPCPRSCFACSA